MSTIDKAVQVIEVAQWLRLMAAERADRAEQTDPTRGEASG